MTELRQIKGDTPIGIGMADTPRTLSNIHTPGCAAAIWQRRPLKSFQSWLEGLTPEKLPTARLILRAEAVADAMLHFCQLSNVPDCPERDLLVGDIAALASIFANVMDTE